MHSKSLSAEFLSRNSSLPFGGTGAQGLLVVRNLVEDDKQCPQSDLRCELSGCDAAFVNIDGFNTREAELFWGMGCYDLAIEDHSVRFFVYGKLLYSYKMSGNKR
jgi:hypothetical protein